MPRRGDGSGPRRATKIEWWGPPLILIGSALTHYSMPAVAVVFTVALFVVSALSAVRLGWQSRTGDETGLRRGAVENGGRPRKSMSALGV